MQTTTIAVELDGAIQLAREAAAALVKAARAGRSPERIAQLRAVSRECERRVSLLTA
jgi:hypothetical protein